MMLPVEPAWGCLGAVLTPDPPTLPSPLEFGCWIFLPEGSRGSALACWSCFPQAVFLSAICSDGNTYCSLSSATNCRTVGTGTCPVEGICSFHRKGWLSRNFQQTCFQILILACIQLWPFVLWELLCFCTQEKWSAECMAGLGSWLSRQTVSFPQWNLDYHPSSATDLLLDLEVGQLGSDPARSVTYAGICIVIWLLYLILSTAGIIASACSCIAYGKLLRPGNRWYGRSLRYRVSSASQKSRKRYKCPPLQPRISCWNKQATEHHPWKFRLLCAGNVLPWDLTGGWFSVITFESLTWALLLGQQELTQG